MSILHPSIFFPLLKSFQIHPSKVEMGLDLVELEAAALSVQEEDLVIENAIHEMIDDVDNLAIDDKKDENK